MIDQWLQLRLTCVSYIENFLTAKQAIACKMIDLEFQLWFAFMSYVERFFTAILGMACKMIDLLFQLWVACISCVDYFFIAIQPFEPVFAFLLELLRIVFRSECHVPVVSMASIVAIVLIFRFKRPAYQLAPFAIYWFIIFIGLNSELPQFCPDDSAMHWLYTFLSNLYITLLPWINTFSPDPNSIDLQLLWKS